MAENLAIEIKNLQFGYHSTKPVLEMERFCVEEKKKVFLYGPSGYGKSTLLNIVSGVLTPQQGEITILGQNISKLSSRSRDNFRGKHFGYIFQSFNLIPYLDVLENVLLPTRIFNNGSSASDLNERARQLIDHLQLTPFIHQKALQLSIGQQQRVAAARALINTPDIVVADEPTSSLDEKNTELFMSLLLEEWKIQNFTLFFVSHDRRLEKYFDHSQGLDELNKVSVQ